jgi:hypothetical protein
MASEQNVHSVRILRLLCMILMGLVTVQFHNTSLLHAQENVGQITGVVNDPSGARVPDASVTAVNLATGVTLEVKTNEEGVYRFPSLPIGQYTLTARATGFKVLEQLGVRAVAGVTLTLPLQLQVGNSAETVNVSAPAVAVDTSASTEGTTQSTDEINELPLLLNGGNRNAIEFLKTLPGVVAPVNGSVALTTINGSPEGGASLTIDGVMGSVQASSQLRVDFSPPPEAISEIRLNATDTSEYGWNSGVGVTLVTKSGTNQLHGDVFEYFRNKVLNATNWFATTPDPSKQNEYGFTLGGPVFLPKVYDGRDKTFFFIVYSGFAFRTTPEGVVISVPTAKMRTGDFSELLPTTQLYDGLLTTEPNPSDPGTFTRQPFPGNIIPLARESSISKYLWQSFPLPNRPGLALNYAGGGAPSPVNSQKGSVKIDQNFREGRQRVTFAYDNIHSTSVNGGTYTGALSNGSLSADNTWTSRLSYLATLSPTLLFTVRAGLNMNGLASSGMGPTSQAQNAGTLSGYGGNFSTQIPQIEVTDFSTFGPPTGGFAVNKIYTIPVSGDFTWTKGTHYLKFGASWASANSKLRSCNNCAGTALYLPFFTSMFFPNQGYGMADMFLGAPLELNVSTPVNDSFRTAASGVYVQDSWRVSGKLTLSYGLRFDRFDMPTEANNRMSVLDPNQINTMAGGVIGSAPGNWPGALSFFGKGPGENGMTAMGPPENVWGPRVGFAYAFTPKLVIRGGFGISSSANFGLLESGVALAGEPGYTWDPALFFYEDQYGQLAGACPAPYTYVQCPYLWDGGFPGREPHLPNLDPNQANTTSPPYWNPYGLKPGYSENINFGIEQEVHGILLKAAYVGNLAHHLPVNSPVNDMNPKYLSLGTLLDDDWGSPPVVAAGLTPPFPEIQGQVWRGLVQYPQFANVNNIADPIGNSSYNALQLSAQKRYGNGLSFLASYTASKQLDNYTDFNGQGVATINTQNSFLNYQLKALGELDRPQNLTLSYVYELPFGSGKRFAPSNAALKPLVSGWQVAGIQTYTSGAPISLFSGELVDGAGETYDWPTRVPGQPYTLASCGSVNPNGASGGQYLNPAAFIQAPVYTYGDINTLPSTRNCPYFDEDLSFQKITKIRERFDVLFSVDFSNLLNRHTFTGLQTDVSETGAFGRFTSATNPRVTQLHLKIEF